MQMTAILTILGATVAAALLIVSLLAAPARRQSASGQPADPELTRLRRELDMLTSFHSRTDQQIKRLEQAYAAVIERLALAEESGIGHSFDPLMDWGRSAVSPQLPARLYSRRKIA
jgi:hypothetical protein